jgi:predicted kinase
MTAAPRLLTVALSLHDLGVRGLWLGKAASPAIISGLCTVSSVCYSISMSKLVLICGLSFAGKSTLGTALAQHFGYAKVDLDGTMFRLYGPAITDEELDDGDWDSVYRTTYAQIDDYLAAGTTVVHDSGNFSREERARAREVARRREAEVVTIYIDTPEPIARQRHVANRTRTTRLDVSDKDFVEALHAMEPPGSDEDPLVFPSGTDSAEWIERHAPVFQ